MDVSEDDSLNLTTDATEDGQVDGESNDSLRRSVSKLKVAFALASFLIAGSGLLVYLSVGKG